MDLHALRERSLNIIQRGVDALCQFQRVDPRLLLNADDHRGFGVMRAFAPLDRCAFTNDTDISYQHRRSIGGLDAHRGNCIDIAETADAAHEVSCPCAT